MFKGNSKHLTGREPTLFHRGACERGKSDNVSGSVDVGDVRLEELIHFQPCRANLGTNPATFQMKLIAVSLAAYSIDEGSTAFEFSCGSPVRQESRRAPGRSRRLSFFPLSET